MQYEQNAVVFLSSEELTQAVINYLEMYATVKIPNDTKRVRIRIVKARPFMKGCDEPEEVAVHWSVSHLGRPADD